MDLLWPQPPLTCSSHHDSTLGPLIPVVAACVKDARPSRWLAPLQRPRWPPPPSGWTRHQPRCFRHERVGWRGSAGDVWLLLGARTWRTGRCSHLSVRSCAHLFGHTSQTPPSRNKGPQPPHTSPARTGTKYYPAQMWYLVCWPSWLHCVGPLSWSQNNKLGRPA